MKLTIVLSDNAVYKDGSCFSNLELSGVPENIHALQFNTVSNSGWIEFKEDDFGEKQPNHKITELPLWAIACINKWDEAEAARIAAEEAILAAQQEAELKQNSLQ